MVRTEVKNQKTKCHHSKYVQIQEEEEEEKKKHQIMKIFYQICKQIWIGSALAIGSGLIVWAFRGGKRVPPLARKSGCRQSFLILRERVKCRLRRVRRERIHELRIKFGLIHSLHCVIFRGKIEFSPVVVVLFRGLDRFRDLFLLGIRLGGAAFL